MANTHVYLAPFSGFNPNFTRQERATCLLVVILSKLTFGTLFFGTSDGSLGNRVILAVIVMFCAIPVVFILKYLFSYDVKAVSRKANSKEKRKEKRNQKAEKMKLKASDSKNDISMKYAVMSQTQNVTERDESESSSSSDSDDEDQMEQVAQMQSCAGRLGWVMSFLWAIAATYCTLGIVANFTVEQAWLWLGVQGMTHAMKAFMNEPLRICMSYFCGKKVARCWKAMSV